VWVRSTMTEAKIQALVNRGLLRPKEEVEWRAAAGEKFPTEDVKEQVVFVSFFKRRFNLPVGISSVDSCVVWTSQGQLPRWVPGPTTGWAPGTTWLVPHGT
jgi:hypothetical protein